MNVEKSMIMYRIILFLAYVHYSLQAGQENFFPYGSDDGDTIFPSGNDEYREVILPNDATFPYYDDTYQHIFIQTNGLISFDTAMPNPQSDMFSNSFPLNPKVNLNHIRLIAPFWADVDTSNQRGLIYFRQTSGSNDVKRATDIVRNAFPGHVAFDAKWVLVVTWEDVSFYNHDTTLSSDPRNTFQAVLITNKQDSFVFFFYDRIEWTAGTILGGNPVTGIPASDSNTLHAVVGFDKGDGLTGKDDIAGDKTTLPDVTNFDELGSFAFQVNGNAIMAAGCSQQVADFVTYPPFGSILGGEKVYMYGPCWDNSKGVICQFWTRDEQTLLQTMNGTIEDQNSAQCIPAPFFRVGEVIIKASIDNGETYSRQGVYRIRADYVLINSTGVPVNLDMISVPDKVTRVDGNSSLWYTAENELSVTWSKELYPTNTKLDIHVLNYEEEGVGPRWQEVFTVGIKKDNTGFIKFTPFGLNNVTSKNAFGTIRIRPSNDVLGVILYSDIHPLGYLLEESFQNNPYVWAETECNSWAMEQDENKDHFIKDLVSCPCTLDQALADTARFYADLNCNMFNENDCLLHLHAKHCVMSIFPTKLNSGSKCCYDYYGNLMYSGDYRESNISVGSPSQLAHIAGSAPYGEAGTVPMLSHYKVDMVPFFFCCVMNVSCMKYLHRRPTADCKKYVLPKPSISFGDPHFITFDGSNYTFNGKGDYTMLSYQPASFQLVGRFDVIKAGYEPPYNTDPSITLGATGLTGVVMIEEGADTISVVTSVISGLEIQMGKHNSESNTVAEWSTVDFRGQMWLDFDGVAVSINETKDSRLMSVTVIFRGSMIGVNISRGLNEKSFLTVTPILPPRLMNDKGVVGLLGNWNNNTNDDLTDLRGNSLNLKTAESEDIYEYGLSWRLETNDLFRTTPEAFKNLSTYMDVEETPSTSSLTSNEQQILLSVCENNQQCQFDYLVTRDRDLAEETRQAYETFQWVNNTMKPVAVCTFIPAPENGQKIYLTKNYDTGELMDNPNNFIGTEIIFSCDEGKNLTLIGSGKRICQKNGNYSGSQELNDCVETPCGTLQTVSSGSISIEFANGKIVATVTCDDGYALKGTAKHECVNMKWTGDKSDCESTAGPNVAVIVGATIGAFFFVVIVVAGIFLLVTCLKKDKNKPKSKPVQYSEVEKASDANDYNTDDEKPTPAPRSVSGQSDGTKEERAPINDWVI